MIEIRQSKKFEKAYKKLKPNQVSDVETAIKYIAANPQAGEHKKGNLDYLWVYKFSMVKQKALLGYHYDKDTIIIILIAVGPHENFYRDLKH